MTNHTQRQERLLTIREVASRLGASTRHVYRLIASGELPRPVKVGKASRIPESELNDYIKRIKGSRNGRWV